MPVMWKADHDQNSLPLDVDCLVDAVNWWDTAGSLSSERSKPPQFSDSSVQFVSYDDPNEVPNFSIHDLVRGSMDTGYGSARRKGVWEHGYWPVLNYENHQPTDEGDRSPWGGEYLYSIDNSLQLFATEFWDQHVDDILQETQQLTVYDFARWIASHP